jgi:hypothetical protein
VVEAAREVVHAVLDVVGDIADLLDPALGLLIVSSSSCSCPAELAEEGLHAGELVVRVLDLAGDTADELVLLGEEAAEFAKQRSHGALGGAHGELHAGSALADLLYIPRALHKNSTCIFLYSRMASNLQFKLCRCIP